MVEAAARALHEHDSVAALPDDPGWDDLAECDRDSYRTAVAAVLGAALTRSGCRWEHGYRYRRNDGEWSIVVPCQSLHAAEALAALMWPAVAERQVMRRPVHAGPWDVVATEPVAGEPS
jgi:hypothetical protein